MGEHEIKLLEVLPVEHTSWPMGYGLYSKISMKHARMLDRRKLQFCEDYIRNQTRIVPQFMDGETLAKEAVKAWEVISRIEDE